MVRNPFEHGCTHATFQAATALVNSRTRRPQSRASPPLMATLQFVGDSTSEVFVPRAGHDIDEWLCSEESSTTILGAETS